MYEGICNAIHRELEQIDDKYLNEGAHLNSQELGDIDKMVHTLKSLATYEAMKGGSEYGGSYGGSYARGRSRTTGRYMSRDSYYRDVPEGYNVR